MRQMASPTWNSRSAQSFLHRGPRHFEQVCKLVQREAFDDAFLVEDALV